MVAEHDEILTTGNGRADARGRTEAVLVDVLGGLLADKHVTPDADFFDDLGANSLVMAHFCARLRKCDDVPSVSMKDIYQHPTIAGLATALAGAERASPALPQRPPEPVRPPQPTSARSYVTCGVIQLAAFLAWSALAGTAAVRGYEWVASGSGLAEIYVRSALVGGAGFVGLCALPVLAKWVLIGRWRPSDFPIWSLTYARFWIVKVLLHVNPMILLVGNPLYVLYLRALGARIGKRVTILSPSLPVATDLLTIGDDSVIRKDAFFSCYRAHAGRIEIGPVTLGKNTFVGEKTVIDIRTSLGDGAQLGHTSALQAGEHVPDGQRWHGSPAQRTNVNYVTLAASDCGSLRRAAFGFATLLQVLLVYCPLAVGGSLFLASMLPGLDGLLQSGQTLDSASLYANALILSLLLFGGFLVVGPLVMFTIPRAVNRAIKPDVVYPLYGFHYSMHRSVTRMTNVKFFKWLFGDSSFIVHYLRCLGYNLSHVEQTGSNFGTEVQHETPFLTTVGRGTMVADGLSVLNADYSSSSFSVAPATIGPHNFLGNNIAYPSGGRTGDNCLLATKVMVPLDGEVRTGVGLLGSPPFEIPRSVERDTRFDHLRTGAELDRRLASKNRYNLASIGLFLVIRWLHVFGLTLLALLAFDVSGPAGALLAAASSVLGLVLTAGYFIVVERAIGRFRPLQPRLTSIYEPYFWWHERLWKVPDTYLNIFNGTPFKNLIWRMLGVRLGKRVFDDGCYITERTLTTIGDECTLNLGSKLQCHSQEDGTFKSDYSVLGARCTLGVGAFVHYGVTIGDEAALAADSFLMKGEEVPRGAHWGGNPASEKWSPQELAPVNGVVVAAGTKSKEAAS